ncbi:hypothetical protein [Cupriavidus sp. PET2-C1]
MPRNFNKPSPVQMLALLLALSVSPVAHAVCDPAASAAAAMTRVVVDFPLEDAGTLLGLDGARVKSDNLEAPLRISISGRARVSLWAEQVDWSVYGLPADKRVGPTVLYFDGAGDNARHLCRVEQYRFTEAFEQRREALLSPAQSLRYASERRHGRPGNRADDARAAGPEDYKLERTLVLRYDGAARLAGFDTVDSEDDAPPKLSSQHCLRYDKAGWLASSGEGACESGSGETAALRYVHDADGHLLRMIQRDPHGRRVQVRTFDAQGKPLHLYIREGPSEGYASMNVGLPYRLPESLGAQRGHDSSYAASNPAQYTMVLNGPDWRVPSVESWHYPWRILLLPGDETAGDIMAFSAGQREVLASGNSGQGSDIRLTAQQKRKIWEAARARPGRVFWNYAPGQDLVLVAAMPEAVWRQCADTAERTAQACEAQPIATGNR